MADTISIPILDNAWTEVSTAAASGFLTNNGSQSLLYTEAASLPAAGSNLGHPLESNDFVSYAVTGGQKIFCKNKLGNGSVAITPG